MSLQFVGYELLVLLVWWTVTGVHLLGFWVFVVLKIVTALICVLWTGVQFWPVEKLLCDSMWHLLAFCLNYRVIKYLQGTILNILEVSRVILKIFIHERRNLKHEMGKSAHNCDKISNWLKRR